MSNQAINGLDLLSMIDNGAKQLGSNIDRINALNVFPVPDGDTGTNMQMTIDGGALEGSRIKEENIGYMAKMISRAMVMSARGNSGVILSQFFKGISISLENKHIANVLDIAKAFKSGTERAYSVVSNPTEGTILTVMREAGENAYKIVNKDTTLEDYLAQYIKYANESLENTPNLLPVLKKAGVIDSGGAGFVLVIEGMLKALRGEIIEYEIKPNTVNNINVSGFNADSELSYGYCTEFVLQLQNSKVNPNSFDLNVITEFLTSIGNSVVSFKDDDIIKAHVHTFDPGLVLTECRKYGEFLTIKIENMNVQHSENTTEEVEIEHKKYAIVAVGNGEGITNIFKEMNVDVVVSGGQTMNTSTQDFIAAFDKINADNIFVYPNNGNIIMAANQAKEAYNKSNIIVIPSKTIAEGYSAISMLNFDSDDLDEIIEEQNEIVKNVSTLEVTYSVRDTNLNGIDVKKGDYICIYNHELISSNPDRLLAVKEAINNIPDFTDKQVMLIICGKDVNMDECNSIVEYATSINSYIEAYPVEGNQDIYSYIIGLE